MQYSIQLMQMQFANSAAVNRTASPRPESVTASPKPLPFKPDALALVEAQRPHHRTRHRAPIDRMASWQSLAFGSAAYERSPVVLTIARLGVQLRAARGTLAARTIKAALAEQQKEEAMVRVPSWNKIGANAIVPRTLTGGGVPPRTLTGGGNAATAPGASARLHADFDDLGDLGSFTPVNVDAMTLDDHPRRPQHFRSRGGGGGSRDAASSDEGVGGEPLSSSGRRIPRRSQDAGPGYRWRRGSNVLAGAAPTSASWHGRSGGTGAGAGVAPTLLAAAAASRIPHATTERIPHATTERSAVLHHLAPPFGSPVSKQQLQRDAPLAPAPSPVAGGGSTRVADSPSLRPAVVTQRRPSPAPLPMPKAPPQAAAGAPAAPASAPPVTMPPAYYAAVAQARGGVATRILAAMGPYPSATPAASPARPSGWGTGALAPLQPPPHQAGQLQIGRPAGAAAAAARRPSAQVHGGGVTLASEPSARSGGSLQQEPASSRPTQRGHIGGP